MSHARQAACALTRCFWVLGVMAGLLTGGCLATQPTKRRGRTAARAVRTTNPLAVANEQALALYEQGDRRGARDTLRDAVRRAEMQGHGRGGAAVLANLAAIEILSARKPSASARRRGEQYMARARDMDPAAAPDPRLQTPAVTRALALRPPSAPEEDTDVDAAEPAVVQVRDADAADLDAAVTPSRPRRDRAAAGELDAELAPSRSAGQRRQPGHLFLALGLGTGTGWHPAQVLEGQSEFQTSAGYANTGLILMPELGFQLTSGFALSIQGRQQLVEPGQWQPTDMSPAPKMAHAAFLKATWSIGDGPAVFNVSALAGGGDGFRLRVPRRPATGLTGHDTVRGGPIACGAGVGFAYHFAPAFAWFADVRGLAGFPDFAVVTEAGTGVAVGF